jgi:hypothetical protein
MVGSYMRLTGSKFMLRFHSAFLAGLALALPASAQYYGGSNNYASSTSQAFSRGLSGSGDPGGNLRSFSVGGNGGFLGGGGGVAATPWTNNYGGYVQPANSGVLQDSIARQQAYYQGNMQRQDQDFRALQLKQATFDEMMYEKMRTPPPEVVREGYRRERLMRARNVPPDQEISSGQALNELLVNVQRIEARDGIRGYLIPLDPETVKHLNVTTTGGNAGSNEFFKTDQLPDWPNAFSGDNFAADRKRVQDDIAAMVRSQRGGQIDRAKSNDARQMAGVLKAKLYDLRSELSFSDYSEALGFLNKLTDTINVLAKPGAKNFVDGTYAAKGSTVGELIEYMTSKGLRFAQATPGYEPYYLGFYQQMVTYDIGLSRLVGDQSTLSFQPPPTPPMDP